MTFSIIAFNVMTLSVMAFSIMTFSIIAFRIMTFSIMTFSIMTFTEKAYLQLSLSMTLCHYADYVIMQSVVMLSVVALFR
jgi:hypothetical protein